MSYVYVLSSQKDHRLYIGLTQDVQRRFEEHELEVLLSGGGRHTVTHAFAVVRAGRRMALDS